MRRPNLPNLADRNDAERINRDWNTYARDGRITVDRNDGDLVRAVARLHADDDAPHVESAFADRLLNQLVARHPTTSPMAKRHRDRTDTMQHIAAGISNPIDWPGTSPRRSSDGPRRVLHTSGWIDLIAIAAVVTLIFSAVMADRDWTSIQPSSTESGFQLAAATPGSEATRDASASAMYRGNAARTGEMPGPGPVGAPSLAWAKQVEAWPGPNAVSANDRIFYTAYSEQTQTFDLRAANLETGEDVWSAPIDVDVTSVPAVANGMIYIVATAGLKAVEEDTGDVAWTYPVGDSGTNASPVVHEGILYIVSGYDYAMQAMDAVTGDPLWSVQLPGTPPTGGYIFGSTNLAVSGDKVFGRGNDGIVFALDSRNGDTVWETTLEGPALEPFLVSEGVLVLTAIDYGQPEGPFPTRLHALDAATGEPVWEPVDLSSPSTLAAADGALFVADSLDDTGTLTAFDIDTGEPLWAWEGEGRLGSPVIADGGIYITAYVEGTVHRIDAATGTSDWAVGLGPVLDPIVIDGLLLATGNGAIHAVAGGEEMGTPAPNDEPADLSGLPPCEPPRTPPTEPLTGEPAATVDAETSLIESLGTPPVTIDGRPFAITNWPVILAANVPSGDQASPEQTARAEETIAAMAACSRRPGGESQIAGFFSDDFFRRGIVTPGSGTALTWGIQPDEEQLESLDVFVLEDGRVAASAVSDWEAGTLLVFVEEDGAWLVDEVYWVLPEYPVSA